MKSWAELWLGCCPEEMLDQQRSGSYVRLILDPERQSQNSECASVCVFFLMISGMECSGRSRGFSCHRAFQRPALNSFSWVVVFWADPAEMFLCLFSISAMNKEQERLMWLQIELRIQLKESHYGKQDIKMLNVVLILSNNKFEQTSNVEMKLLPMIHLSLFVTWIWIKFSNLVETKHHKNCTACAIPHFTREDASQSQQSSFTCKILKVQKQKQPI